MSSMITNKNLKTRAPNRLKDHNINRQNLEQPCKEGQFQASSTKAFNQLRETYINNRPRVATVTLALPRTLSSSFSNKQSNSYTNPKRV